MFIGKSSAQLDTELPPLYYQYHRNVESVAKKMTHLSLLGELPQSYLIYYYYSGEINYGLDSACPMKRRVSVFFASDPDDMENGGSKGTKTPFHAEVPLSRKDEIDDNDGDDSVANVPLKFQGLEHDDSISKWKNARTCIRHCHC